LTIKEIAERASSYGYDGVELMAKRPHALPSDLDGSARREAKQTIAGYGLDIPALAGYTNFADPLADRRDKELVYAKALVDLAVDLDVKLVRVFAAGMGDVDHCATYLQYWDWCKERLKDVAKMGEDAGVTIGLQNHTPVIQSYVDVINMIEEIGSPALKAIIDPPLLTEAGESVEQAIKASAPHLAHFVHVSDQLFTPGPKIKTVGGSLHGRALRFVKMGDGSESKDLKTWIRVAREIGFNGTISYEVCSPVYRSHKLVPIEDIHELVKHAAAYLRDATKGQSSA
jgi:sugar phosphate isomerase/epimerase